MPDFNQLDLGEEFNVFYKECKEKYKFKVDINIKNKIIIKEDNNKKKKNK
jgi:hypothetical protein